MGKEATKVIVVDARTGFLEDIATRLILSDNTSIDIVSTLDSAENLHNAVSSYQPDIVAVCENVIGTQEDWHYADTSVVGYTITPEGPQIVKQAGLPTYGVVKNAQHLLNLLSGAVPKVDSSAVKPAKKPESATTKYTDVDDEPVSKPRGEERTIVEERKTNTREKDDYRVPRSQHMGSNEDEDLDYERPRRAKRPVESRQERRRPRRPAAYDDYDEYEDYPEEDYEDDYPDYDDRYDDYDEGYNDRRGRGRAGRNRHYPASRRRQRYEEDDHRLRDPRAYDDDDEIDDEDKPLRRGEVRNRRGSRDLAEARRKGAARAVQKDLMGPERKTTVVTIYAAKGGVGKTTLASNIATYLALTSYGRDKYRTCIVDYNIDFGDVRSTLGFDNDGVDMTEWSMDIKDRLDAGERPEEIWYTRDEIEGFLQTINKTGLYGLLAPLTHEESMDIEREELNIMLRNIVRRGGFDFVVCDTGNNTRDSSVFALKAADYVLLVATQDATTATCNISSIDALEKVGFNLKKVRLIVNNVMSAKATGIPVRDVEEAFGDFPCIARIKHDTDVTKANNQSVPIVLQPNHEVTKELRNVIAFLTGNEDVEPVKKKFKLFRHKG